jgi:hypothetical protein
MQSINTRETHQQAPMQQRFPFQLPPLPIRLFRQTKTNKRTDCIKDKINKRQDIKPARDTKEEEEEEEEVVVAR